MNINESLFDRFGCTRYWLTEDLTTGESRESRQYSTQLTGLGYADKAHKLNLFLAPDPFFDEPRFSRPSVATVTKVYVRKDDGCWEIGGFGKCIPGHTYKFQLLFGGLPSNVFTWTVPT